MSEPAVDQGYGAWLKAPELVLPAAANVARWPTQGVTLSVSTPFATAEGAAAEAARLLAFMGGPLVQDTAVVDGECRDLQGRCITLVGDQLGYDAGIPVFVIKVAEQDAGTSILTVLRRLA